MKGSERKRSGRAGGDVRKGAASVAFLVIELKFESSGDECLKCPRL